MEQAEIMVYMSMEQRGHAGAHTQAQGTRSNEALVDAETPGKDRDNIPQITLALTISHNYTVTITQWQTQGGYTMHETAMTMRQMRHITSGTWAINSLHRLSFLPQQSSTPASDSACL